MVTIYKYNRDYYNEMMIAAKNFYAFLVRVY